MRTLDATFTGMISGGGRPPARLCAVRFSYRRFLERSHVGPDKSST